MICKDRIKIICNVLLLLLFWLMKLIAPTILIDLIIPTMHWYKQIFVKGQIWMKEQEIIDYVTLIFKWMNRLFLAQENIPAGKLIVLLLIKVFVESLIEIMDHYTLLIIAIMSYVFICMIRLKYLSMLYVFFFISFSLTKIIIKLKEFE